MTNPTTRTLFERLGGMPAVEAAVDIFYEKIMMDDRINHFFFHTIIERQSDKLKNFLAHIFGAPMPYTGKNMREAHQHLHLTEVHFMAVAEHLVSTLRELEFDPSLIEEVAVLTMQVKKEVLGNEG